MDDYDSIDVERLKDYYRCNYSSGNCSAYLSGKVTPEAVRCIESHFGDAEWGSSFLSSGIPEIPITTDSRKRVFAEKEDAMQSSLKIGGFTLDRKHPDYLKLRVLVTLFGGYFGSRLMSNIREEKGYTYGVFANILSNPGSGLFLIHAETANEYVEPLIREVYAEMDKLRNEPVPAEELSMVQNYMRGEMCRNYESAFSLADAWIFLQTSGLEPSYYQEALETIRQVTPQDIGEMANKYLCKDNLKEIVSGKKIS